MTAVSNLMNFHKCIFFIIIFNETKSKNYVFKKSYIMERYKNHIADITKNKKNPIKTTYYFENVLIIHQYNKPDTKHDLISHIYTNSKITQIADTEFIITGGGPGEKATNFALAFHASIDQTGKIAQMIYPRIRHATAAVFGHTTYVFCVGGRDDSLLNSCEKYNLLEDKWTLTANLNEYHEFACVLNYQNRYLYAFGGKGMNTIDYKIKLYRRIERLDLQNEEAGWEKVDLFLDKEMTKRFWALNLKKWMFKPINAHDIMILSTNDIWKLRDKVIIKSNLKQNDGVGGDQALVLENKGYIYTKYSPQSDYIFLFIFRLKNRIFVYCMVAL